MESIKKNWLWGIFISVLAIFAMSHNAFASDTNIPTRFYRDLTSIGVNGRCAVMGGNFTSYEGNTCVWGTNVGGYLQGRGLAFIETQSTNLVIDHFYEIYLTVGTSSEAQLMIPVMWSPRTSANFRLIYFEQVSTNENIGSSATNESYVATYRFIIRPTSSRTGTLQLGDDTRNTNFIYLGGDPWSVVVDTRFESIVEYVGIDDTASTTQIVNAINQLKQSNEQQVQQERDELEEGQSDLQDAGADSTQDAQQGTASLLSAISQAVGVISSASPTNCKINGNMGNLNIGQLDLCANPVPAFIQTIGSLLLILICVPLAISLFNRFIALFRSFQN